MFVTTLKPLFEDNFIGSVGDDEQVMMLISPQQKNNLIANSGGVLHSKDFISASGHFEGGTLPDVYGVHMIVHPQLKIGRGYEVDGDGNGTWSGGRAVAFTQKWGCLNQFEGLSSAIGPDIGERNQIKLYMSEMLNAAREDDKRVVSYSVRYTSLIKLHNSAPLLTRLGGGLSSIRKSRCHLQQLLQI